MSAHEIPLTLPLEPQVISTLRAGDLVSLTGVLYTGRDAAHARFDALLNKGKPLPVSLAGQTIFYVGPCPPPPGRPIGACGPTTSSRMDKYAPRLLDLGLAAMLGKGPRSPAVHEAIIRNRAVYFAATGGAAQLLAQRVKSAEVCACPDLLSEAVYRLEVKNFPAVVAIDSLGNDLYELGPRQYLDSLK